MREEEKTYSLHTMSTEVTERAIGELYIRPGTPVHDMNVNELP